MWLRGISSFLACQEKKKKKSPGLLPAGLKSNLTFNYPYPFASEVTKHQADLLLMTEGDSMWDSGNGDETWVSRAW